jgi:hypothetical protein
MFPKKGNFFPGGNDRENGSASYASMIAQALRRELGSSHRATKTVMHWTGASERTAKHWLAGHHGPGGGYLIVLMRESEAVCEAILTAAGRRDAVIAARMLAAHGKVAEVMALVRRDVSGPAEDRAVDLDQGAGCGGRGSDDREVNRVNDRNRGLTGPAPKERLNPRQRWYLEALAAGKEVRAGDLQRRWGVSEKTARRDVAALKDCGMIEFVGPPKTGRYRLASGIISGGESP